LIDTPKSEVSRQHRAWLLHGATLSGRRTALS